MTKKFNYITLLSSIDYLEAVLVLNSSLQKVKSKYKLVVACTPNVYSNEKIIDILQKEDIIIEKIPWFEYNEQTKIGLSRYNIKSIYNVGAKVEIFGLNHYDKLIYLDADSFVVKNIDNLFKKKDGSTLIDSGACFCALFVFIPRNHPLEQYKTIMTYENCNDGSLMELLWWQVKDNKEYHIDNRYFYISSSAKQEIKRNVKAYHLLPQKLKYWKEKEIPNTPLANLYKTYLFPIRDKYKEELKKIYYL